MPTTDARHAACAACAAHITNLLGGDYPGGRAELYGRVLFAVRRALDEAMECAVASMARVSDN